VIVALLCVLTTGTLYLNWNADSPKALRASSSKWRPVDGSDASRVATYKAFLDLIEEIKEDPRYSGERVPLLSPLPCVTARFADTKLPCRWRGRRHVRAPPMCSDPIEI
jgi:hypothetical protein